MNRALMPIAKIRTMSARDLVNFIENVDDPSIEEVELCKRLRAFLRAEQMATSTRPVVKIKRSITHTGVC